ncbi:hypothetical protein [Streptomyces sp. AM8-1-1]|uniref:hypothetical protein n=1 Tax=Streptomyces sp. AM8-1-1 TaxID=3075825 RepID=UPI0028C473B7|nr:hypothetical protein [Streptomyces sp. AM8-1-1]WNO73619.1 hypothetical protein RPQ07_19140 [Streptomyces sp. AM8-1-1]
MNLRMIGIASVVVVAALLPLAAVAGPADGLLWPDVPAARGPVVDAKSSTRPDPQTAETDPTEPPAAAGSAVSPASAARCGPELTSPGGIEAQTCVLTQSGDAWARTYYRNATGEELRSVLTLMGPGGRTMQTNCAVEAGDEPGVCETPREPSRGGSGDYSAVAEFAPAEDSDDAPLLLRSGSNSHDSGGS